MNTPSVAGSSWPPLTLMRKRMPGSAALVLLAIHPPADHNTGIRIRQWIEA